MNLKCSYHPKEVIERICASVRWQNDPALCWQCMVDQAPLVKEHKEHIVKVDVFTERISKEYLKVIELRRKDKSKADPSVFRIIENAQTQIYEYQEVIEKRKEWVGQLIQKVLDDFSAQCTTLMEVLFAQYDQKFKYFQDQYTFVTDAIESRYGLSHLPSDEEINTKLKEISEKEEDCNIYLRELKEKLLPPLDLDKNLVFQESLQELKILKDISDQVKQEMEPEQADNDDQGSDEKQKIEDYSVDEQDNQEVGKQDLMGKEILKQVQEQCSVVIEEFKIGVQYRDLLLSRNKVANNQYKDIINESLITLHNPEDALFASRQRTTHAQKLYDMQSPFKESKKYDKAPLGQSLKDKFIDSPITNKELNFIQYDQMVNTEQQRGITSIAWIKPSTVVTGSRDKTIQVTNFDSPLESFTLEGHIDQVTALCPFQNKLLLSGGGNLDSTLIVWSLTQQKQLHKLVGHQSGITSIIDLEDGQSVASGSYDNHAIIWNVHDGTAVCALRKHTAMISCLNLTQGKDHLLTGSWDRSIGVWSFGFDPKNRNVKFAKYQREIKCESAVLCLQKIGDKQQQVAYGGTGNKVVVLDWSNGEVKRVLKTSQFGIQELLLIKSGLLVGLGASDGTIRLWDLNQKENQEKMVLRDPENIYINNFNTSPKMVSLGNGRLGIVNNHDNDVHYNIYKVNIQ